MEHISLIFTTFYDSSLQLIELIDRIIGNEKDSASDDEFGDLNKASDVKMNFCCFVFLNLHVFRTCCLPQRQK